jgi:hypothetical protein
LISCKLIGAFARRLWRRVIRCGPRSGGTGQNDFFKARLDQIIDTDHALAKLGRAIDWRFLEKRFGTETIKLIFTSDGPYAGRKR